MALQTVHWIAFGKVAEGDKPIKPRVEPKAEP